MRKKLLKRESPRPWWRDWLCFARDWLISVPKLSRENFISISILMNLVGGIVVDTCVWIDYFRREPLPLVEKGLQEGKILLSPIVGAELIAGIRHPKELRELEFFLQDLEPVDCGFDHWMRTGKLKHFLASKGLTVTLPDVHIAQLAIENEAKIYSFDKIFSKIASVISLQLISR
ncbi:MAG TPA: PIN domain nuclease [Deltaproteobacteria bacterium]|nr:PIN domain nuclease [Deltaproteobacteria bacterium]